MRERPNPQNSLLISLLSGNLALETGPIRTGSSATQSRLPLRIAGGRTNRAVPRHSRGPVSVSIHGMRTFDADIGSCLQGLFSTHGFCTCGRGGQRLHGSLLSRSHSRIRDRGRLEYPSADCCSIGSQRRTNRLSTHYTYVAYLRCEPEPLTLFGPSERHRTKEPVQGQPAGLPTFGDRFHDIGGKESKP